jgi:hypothetical protein
MHQINWFNDVASLFGYQDIYTGTKTERVAGPIYVDDGKFRHPHRSSVPISLLMTDFSDASIWMMEFSVTNMYCTVGPASRFTFI